MTEGRGTGFPAIYDAMAKNGSPVPVFETDDKTYTLVTLKVHPLYWTSINETAIRADETDQAVDQDDALIISSLDDILLLLNSLNDQAGDQANDQVKKVLSNSVHDKVADILSQLDKPKSRSELFKSIGLKNHTDARKRYLDPLLQFGWIKMTIPEMPSSPNQKYIITETGSKLLKIL